MLDAVRAAETVVDMTRGSRIGNLSVGASERSVLGAYLHRLALVVQGTQTRIAQVRGCPQQQEHHDGLDEPAFTPPTHVE